MTDDARRVPRSSVRWRTWQRRALRVAVVACAWAVSPAPSRADSVAPPSREPPERPKPPAEPTGPRVKLGRVDVGPGIPSEVVRGIIRQSYGRYRLCYEQGLARNRKLLGMVATRFAIGGDGSVSKLMADAASTLPDAKVSGCVRSAMAGLSFPKPHGGDWGGREGEPVDVQVQLHFDPGERPGRLGSRRPPER